MSAARETTPQRIASEVVEALADELVVLNDIATEGASGGGDVDCAIRGARPYWHLRLSEWQVCQSLRYDVTARYLVLVRGDETLALDVLDDPRGIGRYGFRTNLAAPDRGRGEYAAPHDRAAYLTLKRIVKGIRTSPEWEEIASLAASSREPYRARLAEAVGAELAATIDETLASGRPLSEEVFGAVRARLARRQRISPERMRRSVARMWHRLSQPTGLVVLLVGPDGAGKSSVANALADACGQLFRRSLRVHFRPGVLPRPSALARRPDALDSNRPHSRAPHGQLLSLALLTYHWLDALLGYAVRVAPVRARTGLVVVERGFADIAVDPTRYRLQVSPALVRGLARLLPRPDVTMILDAEPEAITARKAELEQVEVRRQLDAWRAYEPAAVRLDASRPLDAVVAGARKHVVAALERRGAATLDGGWAPIPPLGPKRLWIPRRRAPALGALRVQSAGDVSTRMGLRAARVGVYIGGTRLLRATPPPAEVRRALAPHVPRGCTYSVKRAVHPGRYLAVVLDSSGQPVALAKIAVNDATRVRLLDERAAIDRWGPFLPEPLSAPRVVSSSDDALVLEWVDHRGRRRPWLLPVEVAEALGTFFARNRREGDGSRGPAHGDCAPWNLLSRDDGWTLVDWEVALDDAPAFFDAFHYVVQGHAFLGSPSRAEIVRGLDGDGWIGDALAAYAAAAGIPRESAPERFAEYLRHTSSPTTRRDMGERSLEVRRALLASVRA